MFMMLQVITYCISRPVYLSVCRRLKSAHAAFEEQEMARLREEKPGLRTSQYKELAWKAWQKSPANPLKQAALAAAQQDAPLKQR